MTKLPYVDDFRDPQAARRLIEDIRGLADQPVRLMEFCGGHTHAIFRYGLRQLLAPALTLRAGPGCPVCVTAAGDLDAAMQMAFHRDVILATFGDLLRVPGRKGDLQSARAAGADVRVVYSPLDALELARRNPQRGVIFLGIGFETTAPAVAASVLEAEEENLRNYHILSLHKLTPPAMEAILQAGEVQLDGIIGPGHVSAIIGSDAWSFLPQRYGIPCAVAGFEPLDILIAVRELVKGIRARRPAVHNTYRRGVTRAGNPIAQKMLAEVFNVAPADWRGFGTIPASGLNLAPAYAHRDARTRFPVERGDGEEPAGCRCGEVLRAVIEPPECPLFRVACSPQHPIGPCMVSAEGACAAFYHYWQ